MRSGILPMTDLRTEKKKREVVVEDLASEHGGVTKGHSGSCQRAAEEGLGAGTVN